MNDPRDAATGMYNSGLQLDEQGSPQPTRDFGSLLRLNSSQMNPLSKGVKPGSFSSLGQPMNSMYANNPGFFRSQIAQRNQSLTPGAPVMTREQRIAQAQQEGTFGTIRDKFNIDNEGAGLSMNEFGNIFKPKPTQKVPSIQKVNPLDPDTQNSRVLLWYETPTTDGSSAHAVLGQTTFTSGTGSTSGANVMDTQDGVTWSGSDLLVSGSGMKRTMIFSP